MTNSDKAAYTTVDELLLEAGHADVPELRAALLGLRSLADLPLPQPNAQLAAMLAPSADELARKRPLRKHRPTVVSVAVIAGMGLGVSGVAATSPNPGLRQGLVSIQNFDGEWAPALAAPLGGASVPLSAAPASPSQSFQGRSLAEPDSGPYAAELAEGARAGREEAAQRDTSAAAGSSRAMRGEGAASAGALPDGAKNGTGFAAAEPRRSGRHVASGGPVEKGEDNKASASGQMATGEAGYPGADGESPSSMLQRAAVQGVPFWDASLDWSDWLVADDEAPAALDMGDWLEADGQAPVLPGAAQLDAALHSVPELDAALPGASEPVAKGFAATPQGHGRRAAAEPAATPHGHGKRAAAEPAATPQGHGRRAAVEPVALEPVAADPAATPQAPAPQAAAEPVTAEPVQDNSAKKSTGSAPGQLPSGRHFSQTPPPQSVASVADSVGTWLKKNHR